MKRKGDWLDDLVPKGDEDKQQFRVFVPRRYDPKMRPARYFITYPPSQSPLYTLAEAVYVAQKLFDSHIEGLGIRLMLDQAEQILERRHQKPVSPKT